MDDRPPPKPEEHHPEPEIIPPERVRARSQRGRARIWISIDERSGSGSLTGLPRLLALIAAIVGFIAILAVVLMVLLGALLIWVPVVAVLVAGFLVLALLRGYFRPR